MPNRNGIPSLGTGPGIEFYSDLPKSPLDPGSILTKFVRPGGNDNADGSAGDPFATIAHAVTQLPRWPKRDFYHFDITGISETINNFELPPWESGRQDSINVSPPTPAMLVQSPVNIFATPVIDFTIASPSINADPTTGMITITDSGASWTPDEHVGKFIQGANGFALEHGLIVSNTATDLVTTMTGVTAPVDITLPGATLTKDSGSNGMIIDGIDARLQFANIEFESANNTNALKVFNCTANFTACRINGIRQEGFPRQIQNFYACHMKSTGVNMQIMPSGTRWNRCFLDDVVYTVPANGSLSSFQHCVSDGSTPLGNIIPGSPSQNGFGNFDMNNCHIKNASSDGLCLQGGQSLIVNDTIIDDSVGNAVVCDGPGKYILNKVKGSGNSGAGVKAIDGAQVVVDADTDVVGGTEIEIGGNSARTWAHFRGTPPVREEIDSATFTRLHE